LRMSTSTYNYVISIIIISYRRFCFSSLHPSCNVNVEFILRNAAQPGARSPNRPTTSKPSVQQRKSVLKPRQLSQRPLKEPTKKPAMVLRLTPSVFWVHNLPHLMNRDLLSSSRFSSGFGTEWGRRRRVIGLKCPTNEWMCARRSMHKSQWSKIESMEENYIFEFLLVFLKMNKKCVS
jgi:hypothetical protein